MTMSTRCADSFSLSSTRHSCTCTYDIAPTDTHTPSFFYCCCFSSLIKITTRWILNFPNRCTDTHTHTHCIECCRDMIFKSRQRGARRRSGLYDADDAAPRLCVGICIQHQRGGYNRLTDVIFLFFCIFFFLLSRDTMRDDIIIDIQRRSRSSARSAICTPSTLGELLRLRNCCDAACCSYVCYYCSLALALAPASTTIIVWRGYSWRRRAGSPPSPPPGRHVFLDVLAVSARVFEFTLLLFTWLYIIVVFGKVVFNKCTSYK